MTPLSRNVNVKQQHACDISCFDGLMSFVHLSQPLEDENKFEIWGAWGVKLSRV